MATGKSFPFGRKRVRMCGRKSFVWRVIVVGRYVSYRNARRHWKMFLWKLRTPMRCDALTNSVIPSAVEGPRDRFMIGNVKLTITHRDPSTSLGMTAYYD